MGKTVNRKLLLTGLAILAVLFCPSFVFAQGSIYGTVHNSDLTVPAEGEISFFGYLDDTDEEIRIDSSVGAAYDSGHWYDFFPNYLTAAAGNPYDFHFFNTANGQGFILSKLIPNNSYQEENIILAPVSWPSAINGLTGQAISSSSIVISWTGVPGFTYHVYRRDSTSYGSFFRIDDPTGSLSNPGTADSFFVDVNTDGSGGYHYLVIAEDASGNLSPHSEFINISSAAIEAPIITSIVPNSGFAGGGTAITITGNGFDMAGVNATIGGAAITSLVVVSPYEITGLTPPGSAGTADVVATNISSGLSSTLVDGFTYIDNLPPVLDPIGNQIVAEGGSLTVPVSAVDPDGTTPVLTALSLPDNAAFNDNGNGTGVFNFNPNFDQADDYRITIKATDEMDSSLIDTATFSITVTNTNRAPELMPVSDTSVVEYGSLQLIITAYDPDGTMPSLTAEHLPANADFTDNGDGSGTFIFEPVSGQADDYIITFWATDEPDEGAEALEDSLSVTVTVTDVNRPPQLLSPADDSIILDQSPTLDWSDIPSADNYEVWVDNSPMVNSSKRKYIGIASQWTVSLDLPFGTWYWKVRAYYHPSGWSEWSVIFSFRICDIPDTPTLVRPLNGSTGLSQPISMDWADVGGATVYRLRIVSSQIDTPLTVSSFSASGLDNGTAYSWRVQAQNACGLWSGWSSQWTFTTDCPVPDPPSLVSPPDGNTIELVEIVWDSASGVSNYHLQIDTGSAFGNPEIDTMLTSVDFATTELADMTEYYWRVRAENDCGWSQWSHVWKFITNIPTDVTEDELSGLPNDFALSQNYPNPFNPSSVIDYSLSNRSYVRLEVFNLVGELVATLVDEVKSPGRYSVVWNGKDQSGKPVPSGVYLYRLQAGSFTASKKMMLLK